jgi:hypothetical protein
MKTILSILILFISVNIFAQNFTVTNGSIPNVSISLSQNPNPNTANWGNGSSMLMINASCKSDGVRIDPLVVESRILVYIKSKGKRVCGTYTSSSAPAAHFNSASKVWSGSNAVALIGQDCTLTPGDYEICVQFFGNGPTGTIALSEEKCVPFSIIGTDQTNNQPPQLVSPADGTLYSKEDIKKPFIFRWTPVNIKNQEPVTYRLKVWQLMQGQNTLQAIKSNEPIFTKDIDNLTQTTVNNLALDYPCVPPTQCPGAGPVVWNVQALSRDGKPIGGNNGTSATNTFSIMQGGCNIIYDAKIDTIKCISVDTVEICAKFICIKSGYGPPVGYTPIASIITAISILDQNNNIVIAPYSVGNPSITEGNSYTKCIRVKVNNSITQLTVHFDTKLNDPNHPCNNSADGQTKVPDCSCNPCKNKKTVFGSGIVSSTTTYQNDGSVQVNSTVTHSPARIIKVSAEIVNVERMGEAGCLLCTKESKDFGNFTSGSLNNSTGNIVNGLSGYGKQIQWQYNTPTLINNFSYNLNMMFPPLTAVSCCKDSLRICTRWSFTDANCITCDTLICSVIVREYKKPLWPIANNTANEILKIKSLGDPYLSWYNQEENELPKNFEAQSKILYSNLKVKEFDFPNFLEATKVYFYGIRELKNGTNSVNTLTAATMCGNGDFEIGSIDPSEWTGAIATTNGNNATYTPWSTGFSPALGIPVNSAIGVPSNHHTIVTAGPDPFYALLNRVPPQPLINQYALRLGNSVTGSGVEKLEKTFVVSSSNKILTFWYASVFEDYGHGASENPCFRVRVYNASNTLQTGIVYLNNPNIPQDNIIANLNNPFFINAGIDAGGNQIVVKQWTCAKIDLSGLVNQSVKIEFINTDCSQGGHFGYTYIDNICLGCQGSPSGNVTIQKIVDPCIKQGTSVCVDYTLPKNNTTTGSGTIKLQFYQNGSPIAYSITSTNLTTSGTYCFPIDPSQLPCTNGQAGYDMVATGNFSITSGGTTTPITVYSPDPIGVANQIEGIKPGLNNDLVCCVPLADKCCTNFIKQVNTQVTMVGNSTSGYNAIKFVPTFTAGPRPIKKIRISVINFETESKNKECLICESNAARYATMSVTQSYTGGGKDNIEGMAYPTKPLVVNCVGCPPNWNTSPTSEVTWGSDTGLGYNLMDGIGDQTTSFTISLPKASTISCCDDTIKICIKYSFTNVDCITCDTIICYKIVNRKTITPIASNFNILNDKLQNKILNGANMQWAYNSLDLSMYNFRKDLLMPLKYKALKLPEFLNNSDSEKEIIPY